MVIFESHLYNILISGYTCKMNLCKIFYAFVKFFTAPVSPTMYGGTFMLTLY